MLATGEGEVQQQNGLLGMHGTSVCDVFEVDTKVSLFPLGTASGRMANSHGLVTTDVVIVHLFESISDVMVVFQIVFGKCLCIRMS